MYLIHSSDKCFDYTYSFINIWIVVLGERPHCLNSQSQYSSVPNCSLFPLASLMMKMFGRNM